MANKASLRNTGHRLDKANPLCTTAGDNPWPDAIKALLAHRSYSIACIPFSMVFFRSQSPRTVTPQTLQVSAALVLLFSGSSRSTPQVRNPVAERYGASRAAYASAVAYEVLRKPGPWCLLFNQHVKEFARQNGREGSPTTADYDRAALQLINDGYLDQEVAHLSPAAAQIYVLSTAEEKRQRKERRHARDSRIAQPAYMRSYSSTR
jgi:hypothetical protein